MGNRKKAKPGTGLRATVAANVRHRRAEAGLAQSAVAARAGLTTAMISAVEREHREPSFDSLVRIADVLGVEPWRLLRPRVSP